MQFVRKKSIKSQKRQPISRQSRFSGQSHMECRQNRRNFGTPGNPASLGYQEGDRVRHMKFGEGTVQNIVQGGRDYEVTVNFDKVGVKKCLRLLQS